MYTQSTQNFLNNLPEGQDPFKALVDCLVSTQEQINAINLEIASWEIMAANYSDTWADHELDEYYESISEYRTNRTMLKNQLRDYETIRKELLA